MTLKEKFTPHAKYWDCYNDEPLKYDHKNKCEKVADEFAIGFAEWKDKNCYLVMGSESLFYVRDNEIHDDAYTTKELLKIYKKEKGL